MEPMRFSSGLAVSTNGQRTSMQRHRADMASDEHAPVRLRFHHLYKSTRVIEKNMMVGCVSPEISLLVSYRWSNSLPYFGSLTSGVR